MTKVVRILGLPGTGKTTTLISMMKEQMDKGLGMEDICYNTFLKKMAVELKERLSEELNLSENEQETSFPWMTTTHGICKRILNIKNVATDDDRKEFCSKLNLKYFTGEADEDAYYQESTALGNQLFKIKSFLVTNMLPTDQFFRLRVDDSNWKITHNLVERFLKGWDNYKKARGLMDFDDMLQMVLDQKLSPPVKVIFWDEYQDVSPLQHAIAKIWAESVDTFVLAGDPHQTIYSFAGSDPKFFMDWKPHEDILLPTSYRLPEAVWNFVKKNYPKNLPEIKTSPGGVANHLRVYDMKPIVTMLKRIGEKQRVLILARCNYQISKIMSCLREQGVPYVAKRSKWTPKEKAVYNVLYKVPRNLDLYSYELENFVAALKAKHFIKSKDGLVGVKLTREILDASLKDGLDKVVRNFFDDDYDAYSKSSISHNQRIKIRIALDRWAQPMPKIEVSTIHQKKGGEADIVFIFNSLTDKIRDGMKSHDSEEHRVFFTGFTRAKRELYVVEGFLDGTDKYAVAI